ncbi:MAG: hypothetical protein M3O70_08850 [Actinomycetota bacterium]|nr:hypothetical protein [Actinomycetota bacterium]
MRHVANLLELVGLLAAVYGCWLLAPWLGWLVGGLIGVVMAVQMEDAG